MSTTDSLPPPLGSTSPEPVTPSVKSHSMPSTTTTTTTTTTSNFRITPKTSITHPINISWIVPDEYLPFLSLCELPDDIDLYDLTDPCLEQQLTPQLAQAQHATDQVSRPVIGNLALSSCPGKKVRLTGPTRGRAAINRDLDLDFSRMKSFGITTLVCCLDDMELDYLGAPWPKYLEAATQNGMRVIRLPMIEGSCPETIQEMDAVIHMVNETIHKGENVLTHCRGGVGRAGVFACCWLLSNLYCLSAERAIRYVRIRRSPKAIETMRQAEFIIHYSQYVADAMERKQTHRHYYQSKMLHPSAPVSPTHVDIQSLSLEQPQPLRMSHTDYTLTVPSLSDISNLERSMRIGDQDELIDDVIRPLSTPPQHQ
ncbi:phosphatases ii [Lichtheimia corymbifera JMRC:FSU:9682]|uniref:Phosphatases ii n=1 Tax=Lichtheimia corymbifera JMRC:FSU:9682 TaxID=1263082 RepID=A0A068S723_9FUNG|nr:phosphatases ii [Lichtheimia corymbifera JMRC:FSU:9682]